jgi:hypothetical protein
MAAKAPCSARGIAWAEHTGVWEVSATPGNLAARGRSDLNQFSTGAFTEGYAPIVFRNALIMRSKERTISVKPRSANIFNRVFETQKSTRNGKNNAKIRVLVTWHPRVYHAVIKDTGLPCARNGFLTLAMRRVWLPPAFHLETATI